MLHWVTVQSWLLLCHPSHTSKVVFRYGDFGALVPLKLHALGCTIGTAELSIIILLLCCALCRSGKALGYAEHHKSWTHDVFFGWNAAVLNTGSVAVGDAVNPVMK